MQTQIQFSEQLIKGKIAELIFSQMFRNSGKFTVIPFGYENTFPEIAQYANLARDKDAVEIIRNAPDFALVSHDKKEVYLVEVKYRSILTEKYVCEMAEKIQSRWKSVHLFIITPDGFYFGNCAEIINKNGNILKINHEWINELEQVQYLKLINEFI
ncbi:MAG: hypothetical protein SGJ00_11360 [bacterium]|nr:hypothetical protein [bacterium]